MENSRTVSAAASLFLVLFVPSFAFSYERHTHQGLSQSTLKVYEVVRGVKFLTAETEAFIQGSYDEDNETRPLNHFFDPINNRGLKVFFTPWPMSRVWAQDTQAQANYCSFGVCPSRIGYNDKYFSSPTDFSWDRGVYEYVHGDKVRGMKSLGRIIHLLQDATVPAHTRNDQHLNHDGHGDQDPYEKYTSRFDRTNINVLIDSKAVQRHLSLDEFFYSTAANTNQGFLSKDTLFKDFPNPSFSELEIDAEGILHDRRRGIRIAYIKRAYDYFGNPAYENISLEDPKGYVLGDYWKHLSQEAVRNGVGVIDLFFRAVEEERRTGALKNKNTSAAERKAKELAFLGYDLVKSGLGLNLKPGDIAKIPTQFAPASAVLGVETTIPEPAAPPPYQEPLFQDEVSAVEQPVEDTPPISLVVEMVEETVIPSNTEIPTFIQDIFPVPAGGGGGAPPKKVVTEMLEPEAPPDLEPPVITFPEQDGIYATSTFSIFGTASPDVEITMHYGSVIASTTADADGAWRIESVFPEGEQTVSVTATQAERVSVAVDRTFVVDTTAPDLSTFNLQQCLHSLAASHCVSVQGVMATSTTPLSDVLYYVYIVDGVAISTSTSFQENVELAVGDHAIALAAYDNVGNGATSTAVAVEIIERPVVVNEIAWAGTETDTTARWIELFNPTSMTISLGHTALSINEEEPIPLVGEIAPGGFFLIEAEENNTSVVADMIVTFGGLSTAAASVGVYYVPDREIQVLLDQTPNSSACGGEWCAGASDGHYSMERKIADSSGESSSNWRSNDGFTRNGVDAGGTPLNATPKSQNSVSIETIGYYCHPHTTSFEEGGYYEVWIDGGTSPCNFLTPSMAGDLHFGALYRGVVGAAQQIDSHYLGATASFSQREQYPPDLASGEDLFVAVFVPRFEYLDADMNAFSTFFATGANPPPSLRYGLIRFKWGTAPE